MSAHETYGRLTEGLHLAGYGFERACAHLESLLEGDAWRLDGRFGNVNEFLDSLRLDKFRAVAEQRKRIAERIKELQPGATNRQIARTLGVGRRTVDRDVGPNGPPAEKTANEIKDAKPASGPNGPPGLSGEQAAKLIRRR